MCESSVETWLNNADVSCQYAIAVNSLTLYLNGHYALDAVCDMMQILSCVV